MRQIVTTTTGDIDVLKVEEKPDPTPGAGEVVIRVRAAGLNFADILSRQGLYPDSPPKPCVMGYEVSGIVEATGKPVVALVRFGGQSEMVAVKANQMFEKPEQLTFEQAAAIPVNYLTAYALLVVMGSLHAGESVLIHNAGRRRTRGARYREAHRRGDVWHGEPEQAQVPGGTRVGPCDRLSQAGLVAGVAATD